MIIFGGTTQLTRELNDLNIFDVIHHKWIQIFENVSPFKQKSISKTNDVI